MQILHTNKFILKNKKNNVEILTELIHDSIRTKQKHWRGNFVYSGYHVIQSALALLDGKDGKYDVITEAIFILAFGNKNRNNLYFP